PRRNQSDATANNRSHRTNRRSFRVYHVLRGARHEVGAAQPAIQIDIAAAWRTKWQPLGRCRFAADRAPLAFAFALAPTPRRAVFRLSRHLTSRIGPEALAAEQHRRFIERQA